MSHDWTIAFFNWLEKEKKYSPNTVKSYRTDIMMFQNFILDQFESADMLQAGKAEIRTWVMHMLDAGQSYTTVNRKLVSLSTFYNYAVRQEALEANPVETIIRPKKPKRLAGFIDESTTQNIFSNTVFNNEFSGYRDRLMLELLYNTGVRVAELIGITHGSFDANRSELKVLGKGNKERFIPVGTYIIELVETYSSLKKAEGYTCEAAAPLLVTDKGKKLYPVFVSRKVKEVLTGYANISKTNPHLFRHTFATHLLNNGGDINAIKELLGHASLASTSVYTHNSIERLKDVYKKSHPRK
ncbi:tyrosine-type recombinase/integrase [bacterium]|nr:tyrosine-type recombinase/integrase [bacterium]